MHFLGTSKLEWAMVLTALQRGIRKQFNENFTVTFDCASSLATSNGTHYTGYNLEHEGKWSYIMEKVPDNKAWSNDTTSLIQYVMVYMIIDAQVPLTKLMKLNDITCYSHRRKQNGC